MKSIASRALYFIDLQANTIAERFQQVGAGGGRCVEVKIIRRLVDRRAVHFGELR